MSRRESYSLGLKKCCLAIFAQICRAPILFKNYKSVLRPFYFLHLRRACICYHEHKTKKSSKGKSRILTAHVLRLMIAYMKDELGLGLKLAYGSGDLGFSITTTMVGAYLSIFLTDVVGLAPTLVATAIFIGRSVDYINDPIIGHLVDRTRSRWGRRRPYQIGRASCRERVFSSV